MNLLRCWASVGFRRRTLHLSLLVDRTCPNPDRRSFNEGTLKFVLANLRVRSSLCWSRLATFCVVLIRSELWFCLLDKVFSVCFSGIRLSCYGRSFCRRSTFVCIKRGMAWARFGDLVLAVDRRMLIRNGFRIQNYCGGTAIMIVENTQWNTETASSKVHVHHPVLPTMKGCEQ
jgi:hypothetical protein